MFGEIIGDGGIKTGAVMPFYELSMYDALKKKSTGRWYIPSFSYTQKRELIR